MDEKNLTLPPELESSLDEFYAAPEPDPAFASRLDQDLQRRFREFSSPKRDSRRTFMQTLRARPVLAFIIAILALLALTGFAYAIGRLTGFIPGVGFVEDVQSALEEPVVVKREDAGIGEPNLTENLNGLAAQDRGGVTVTIQEVVAETSRTVMIYKVTGLPPGLIGIEREQGQPENQVGQLPDKIRLPDGMILEIQGGSRCSGWSDSVQSALTCRLEFLPLPAGVSEFTLLIHRLQHALPGKLPEDWQIPIRLVPVSPSRMAGGVEEPDLHSQPVNGIRLVLLRTAQTPTDTALQFGLEWEGQKRIVHHTAPITMQDAQDRYYILSGGTEGRSYSAENPNFSSLASLVTAPVKAGEPFTFRMDWVIMSAFGQASLEFDPGENAQPGQEWTLNENVRAGGFDLHFTTARWKEAADGYVTLEFDIEAQEGITGVSLFPSGEQSSSGESGYDTFRGVLVSSVTLSALPAGPLELQIPEVLYKVEGPWEIVWEPSPVDFSPYPTVTPAPTRMAAPAPTLIPGEPLLSELEALLENGYTGYQKGPGWMHQVVDVEEAEDYGLDYGDTPVMPRHYLVESWVRLDKRGYAQTTMYVRKSLEGEFLSADINDGVVHFSLPEGRGGIGEDVYLAAPSYDLDLLTVLNGYVAGGATIRLENVLLDGKACQLYEVTQLYDLPQVFDGEPAPVQAIRFGAWVDPESGKVLQTQNGMDYMDGSSRVKATTRFLSLEKVETPPQEILDLLAKVVAP